jgi:hypothetical protein
MESAQGRDLLEPSASQKCTPAFSEWRDFRILNKQIKPLPEDFLISVQHQQHKLILSMVAEGGNQLFDLANDPSEMQNLANDHLDLFTQREQTISLHIANDLPAGLLSTDGIQISPESTEMLKARGYIQ